MRRASIIGQREAEWLVLTRGSDAAEQEATRGALLTAAGPLVLSAQGTGPVWDPSPCIDK